MTDRPILFSGPMVRAILEGRKTQTRRALTRLRSKGAISDFGPSTTAGFDWHFRDQDMRWHDVSRERLFEVLPWKIGDRLWVREAFSPAPEDPPPSNDRQTLWNIAFAAGGHRFATAPSGYNPTLYNYERWSPSIHMPRWASRLTLVVTDVRIQRLRDISDDDALSEGITEAEDDAWGIMYSGTWFNYPIPYKHLRHYATEAFFDLWDSINGERHSCSVRDNPWVVAITFKPHHCNIDKISETAS